MPLAPRGRHAQHFAPASTRILVSTRESAPVATHLLYGLRGGSAAEAAAAIADRFGYPFHERESHYMGEYWLARIGSTYVKVVNSPDVYGVVVEDDFADHATLIYVDGDTPVADLSGTPVGDGAIEKLRPA